MNQELTSSQKPLIAGRRRSVVISSEDLVTVRPLNHGASLPLLIEPRRDAVDLAQWLRNNTLEIERDLQKHGGILFRNFRIDSPQAFEGIAKTIAGELLAYKERSSPRTKISGNVYTSTDYPPDQPIFLHNENSYQQRWPLKIFFCCLTPAQEGGATPIADVRKVFARITDPVKEKFRAKKVMYIRNFGTGLGLPWEEVFQSTDRQAIEEHCRHAGIQLEWLPGDRLRTRAVREAMLRHPKTGEWVWFNHATFFHIATREPAVRESLLSLFKTEDLPTNSCYGDGSPIEPEVIEELQAAYHAETTSFPWEKGDVLLLDNMLVAHGRAPFSGERKVVVGMAEPWEPANA